MGNTTFSGPIRAGTVKEGSGANIGGAVLSQTAAFTFADTGTFATSIILPAGTQILDTLIDVTTPFNSVTEDALEIGDGTDADKYGDLASLQTGGLQRATRDATQSAATDDIGDSDVTINLTITSTGGSLSAGAARITILYRQFATADSLG